MADRIAARLACRFQASLARAVPDESTRGSRTVKEFRCGASFRAARPRSRASRTTRSSSRSRCTRATTTAWTRFRLRSSTRSSPGSPSGSRALGVEQLTADSGERLIAASDRDYGSRSCASTVSLIHHRQPLPVERRQHDDDDARQAQAAQRLRRMVREAPRMRGFRRSSGGSPLSKSSGGCRCTSSLCPRSQTGSPRRAVCPRCNAACSCSPLRCSRPCSSGRSSVASCCCPRRRVPRRWPRSWSPNPRSA